MRKRFLTRLNVVLGALSMSLAGCVGSQKAYAAKNPPEPKKYGPPPDIEVLEEKYGIPAYLLDEPEEPVQEPDTVPANDPANVVFTEPEPPSTLYGPPYGWDEPVPVEEEEILPPPEEKVKCKYGAPRPRRDKSKKKESKDKK